MLLINDDKIILNISNNTTDTMWVYFKHTGDIGLIDLFLQLQSGIRASTSYHSRTSQDWVGRESYCVPVVSFRVAT